VTNSPWQKVGSRVITDPARRFELVSAAVADTPGLAVSDVELRIGGPSYTMNTIERLTAEEPDVTWSVIVGTDAAAGLDTWYRAAELKATQRFVVVNRPGAHGQVPPGWAFDRVAIPPLDVSSTELRAMVEAGRSIRYLTPLAVVQLLDAWGLYRRES
jgi:nicotinate-nucleotide adenylyltransferase